MSPNNTYAATLLAATSYLTLSIDLITFVIGTTGSVCNLIIFTAPRLRRNACVFYLLCATVFQLITIIFIVPVRLASNNFGSNLDNQSIIYCKIRYYLAITLPESATYYILLSIMDRCLATSTNVGIRAWSNLKVTYRMSVGILIFIFIANIQLIVFFTIYNNSCQIKPDSFETFYGPSYILILAMIIPYTLMLILSLKTYFQMRKIKRRITPVSNSANHTQTSRFESQIIMIILLQIIVTSTLLLIRIVSYAYTIFTSDNFNKTLTERAIENFIVQSSSSLYFFSFAISFYVSTLTSKYFRDIFKKRIAHLYGHCRRQ